MSRKTSTRLIALEYSVTPGHWQCKLKQHDVASRGPAQAHEPESFQNGERVHEITGSTGMDALCQREKVAAVLQMVADNKAVLMIRHMSIRVPRGQDGANLDAPS